MKRGLKVYASKGMVSKWHKNDLAICSHPLICVRGMIAFTVLW